MTNEKVPKILVVEDMEEWVELWKDVLYGAAELIGAASIEEAEEKFAANPDIDVVVVDGCVPGSELNTIPLVQKFKATFKGPMIAVSGNPDFQKMLIKEGCSHECEKKDLPEFLRTIGIFDYM
ncbi:MAG: response regulator [Candidatus Jorgensenbacteria bacterium]